MKQLLSKLVRCESTAAAGELSAAQVIRDEFARSGIETRIDVWDENRANVSAWIEAPGDRDALLFACHLDVVGPGEATWKHPPFSGIEADGRIHGRGSADMKGGITAVVTAIKQVVEAGTELLGGIVFAALAGEETDSCGALRFIRDRGNLPELAGVIIPEPTNFDIVTAHRGMLWLELTTRGKTAHSSTPHLGVNAITSMRAVLDELAEFDSGVEPHELLGGCSMSINTIVGGKALNVVPDKCTIGIDFRTLPAQNHLDIVSGVREILAKLRSRDAQFDADVTVLREVEPLETDNGCSFVRDLCSAVGIDRTEAVGFTTDGPHFARLGVPVVIFGPGKSDLCHKPDEYIDICDVEKGVDYYRRIILKFLT